ncbi:agamous-like MADS-box protein AGL18 [Brassica rapa]|nr:agamous-like MADS-box protein AGL18 [Brassica rapa]
MVRGKIELKKIENANRLQVSFTNRRKVLMKKANDLSILCDADVALIVFSSTGNVYNFSSRSMEQILYRYGYVAADHRQREESMASELKRLQLAVERAKGKELEGMSFSDLISLESQLNDSLLRVKDQKTILLNQLERSRLQEKRTLEENRLLRKQIESMVGRGSSGPQVEPEKNDNEEHLSDTSLQLGWGKRKKLKIERPAITLSSD